MIMKHLKVVQNTEEKKLIEIQRNTFLSWKQNRSDLIKAQVISGKFWIWILIFFFFASASVGPELNSELNRSQFKKFFN